MKIKLTKGELKRQRDALRRYRRFLPMLQLKKQQLQMELLHEMAHLEKYTRLFAEQHERMHAWAGLLSDPAVTISAILTVQDVVTHSRSIAGVDIPVFDQVRFAVAEYDLFLTPLWVDAALHHCEALLSLREHTAVLRRSVALLRHELRIATQRVNVFEKVKIPEAEEAIRQIKIYIGDQLANAVGRSKIAKRKIEEADVAMASVTGDNT